MPVEPDFRRIAREISERIESGELAPDEWLPPLAQIAEQFRVSVSTVQRALSLLDDRGLIRGHQGKGVRVRPSS